MFQSLKQEQNTIITVIINFQVSRLMGSVLIITISHETIISNYTWGIFNVTENGGKSQLLVFKCLFLNI